MNITRNDLLLINTIIGCFKASNGGLVSKIPTIGKCYECLSDDMKDMIEKKGDCAQKEQK